MNPSSLAMGQGSKLDNSSSATSRSGDISSRISFQPEGLYYKSSTLKTEHYIILSVVLLLVIYLWRA
jgi:hypothetical protein